MLGAVTTRALACDKARPASGLHMEIADPAHRIRTKIENKYEITNRKFVLYIFIHHNW